MRKRGFTLVEFICSLLVMFLTVAFALPIFFKKQPKPKEYGKTNGEQVCTCTNTEGYCEFEFSNSDRYEFYTIQLTGGGASGGVEKGGGAGEVKVLYLPALDGTYRIQLGQEGQYDSADGGQHGGITALYKKNTNGTYKLVDYARGGISNNEKIDTNNSLNQSTEESLPALNTGTGCGKGGAKQQNGTAGEGVIRW